MSYRKTYNATVYGHIYRNIPYTYPASKTGGAGTVVVNEDVPAHVSIDIDVETSDFDHRINNCKHSVDVLTGAVAATSAAEVATKAHTSKQIGGKIIKGFFDFVKSDMSQQMTEMSSKLEATLMQLVEQKKALGKISNQMENDYNRIYSRYSKLFEDLNNELHNRIFALIRPVLDVKKQLATTLERTENSNNIGCVTVSSAETSRLNSILSAAAVKRRTIEIIDCINRYLENTYILTNSLNHMLSNTDEPGQVFLPVMYIESTSKSGIEVEQKSPAFNKLDSSLLEKGTIEQFQSNDLDWNNMSEEEFTKIKFFLDAEFVNSGLSKRQVSLMERMLEQNTINVLQK